MINLNQISNSEMALQAAWSSMPFAVREMFEWTSGSVLLLNERVVQWMMVQSLRESASQESIRASRMGVGRHG